MKRKITALLLAVAMMFTVFAFVGCDDGSDPGGSSSPPAQNGSTPASGDETTPSDDPEPVPSCFYPADNPAFTADNCPGFPNDWQCGCLGKKADVAKFRELQGNDPGDRTVINFYTFTSETVNDLLPLFLANNEDFAKEYFINIEMAANAQAHILSVQNNIGKEGGPDIFVADVDYAMQFARLPQTATITDLGITIDESAFYQYTLDLMKNAREDGAITGLSHQATPGGMIYRADIAKEVLGVNSEAEMQAMVSTWDDFLDVAKKITDATDFAMIYGADELKRNFLNTRETGWVNANDEFTICQTTISEFVRVTKEIQDMDGLKSNGTGQWGGNWDTNRAAQTNGVFSYFGSTWYLHFIHEPNVGATKGQWGIVPGPASFYWGGTYWFGSQAAAADADKKDAVSQIIEFFCVNEDTIEIFVNETGDFTSNRNVAEKFANDASYNNDLFLWKTNHHAVFATIADRIDITKNITRFDADMDTMFGDFITNVFARDMSMADALGLMREAVRARLPEVTVA